MLKKNRIDWPSIKTSFTLDVHDEIDEWLAVSLTGDYYLKVICLKSILVVNAEFFFENTSDLLLFELTWM